MSNMLQDRIENQLNNRFQLKKKFKNFTKDENGVLQMNAPKITDIDFKNIKKISEKEFVFNKKDYDNMVANIQD